MPRYAGEPPTDHHLAREVRNDPARFARAVQEHLQLLGSFAVSDHYVSDEGLPLGKWFAEIRATRRPESLAFIVDHEMAWRWPMPDGSAGRSWGELAFAVGTVTRFFEHEGPSRAIASLQGRGDRVPGVILSAARMLDEEYASPAASAGFRRLLDQLNISTWQLAPAAPRVGADVAESGGRVAPASTKIEDHTRTPLFTSIPAVSND